jgi:signal peptidase
MTIQTRATPRGRSRRVLAAVGDGLLTVAAVLGSVCIVLVIAAAVFDVRIVLFSTGSMSPTIPAGSAALVRTIPAEDIGVGDVVTVEREGRLPITHRVVSVDPSETSSAARSIVMRGDANDVDDPAPYDVSEVGLTVFSVPEVAPVLASAGSPGALGSVTVAATALVVAVFWPRRRPGAATDGDAPGTSAEHAAEAEVPPMGERRRRRLAERGGAVTAVGLLGAALLVGAPAPAEARERVIRGEVITLVSIEQPEMRTLTPGARAVWQVGVSADTAESGTITLALAAAGDDARGLSYRVDACPRRWVDSACDGARALIDEPVAAHHPERQVGTIRADEPAWLRIEVTLTTDAGSLETPVELILRARGVGDAVGTGTGLPTTGGSFPWPLLGAALILTTAGAGILAGARRTRSS